MLYVKEEEKQKQSLKVRDEQSRSPYYTGGTRRKVQQYTLVLTLLGLATKQVA